MSWDPIAPLKPHLGGQFHSLVGKLERVIAQRYRLPPWTPQSYAAHKYADRLAAASEAHHVVGWSLTEIRDHLEIELDPLQHDPLSPPAGLRPWEPWPSKLAARLFSAALQDLRSRVECDVIT